jgi:hypothetical protein
MPADPLHQSTQTPSPKPFGCAGFVAYLRGGNLSTDDAEMLAKKFEAADAELDRLREALRLIADFRPTPGDDYPAPHSQIAIAARTISREALAT